MTHSWEATKNLPRACGHCMWWVAINSVSGQCRRNPPHATPFDMLSDGHYWPITNRDTWCGEYTKLNEIEGDQP